MRPQARQSFFIVSFWCRLRHCLEVDRTIFRQCAPGIRSGWGVGCKRHCSLVPCAYQLCIVFLFGDNEVDGVWLRALLFRLESERQALTIFLTLCSVTPNSIHRTDGIYSVVLAVSFVPGDALILVGHRVHFCMRRIHQGVFSHCISSLHSWWKKDSQSKAPKTPLAHIIKLVSFGSRGFRAARLEI